jgi:hypothetical protein
VVENTISSNESRRGTPDLLMLTASFRRSEFKTPGLYEPKISDPMTVTELQIMAYNRNVAVERNVESVSTISSSCRPTYS